MSEPPDLCASSGESQENVKLVTEQEANDLLGNGILIETKKG